MANKTAKKTTTTTDSDAYGIQVLVRLPKGLKNRLDAKMKRDGTTRQEWFVGVVERAVGEKKAARKPRSEQTVAAKVAAVREAQKSGEEM